MAAVPAPATAPMPLVSLVAHTNDLGRLLPELHQQALDATGGGCSVLFQANPHNGAFHPTSASGLDELHADPWHPDPGERALLEQAFAHGPLLVEGADRQSPDLAARLGTADVLLLPLGDAAHRLGLLAIGFAGAPTALPPDAHAQEIADAFLLTLRLSRLRQNEELQQDIHVLLEELGTTLSSTLSLPSGLDAFCHGASRLFGADRTSVWLHDRRARHLTLRASSDPRHLALGARVTADDGATAVAAAMRMPRAAVVSDLGEAATTTVAVPLRGCRRALGTLVFDGVRVAPGGELDLLDRADEIGRQLSTTIENMQLLEDVLRSRRELENIFDSIAHLVVVADRRGRIVHANEAFARRLRRSREELVDRPLAECFGRELTAWLAARQTAAGAGDVHTPETCEVVDPVLDGPFMVTVTDLLNQERELSGSVIVARDTTQQTELEAEREELRRQLTQSEKLAALGQFVAGIAHELNNPLQGVLGHLELLRATGAFPKPLRREVQTIYREADRAAKIVRNLLVFAGSRRSARRPVSVNAVMQKVCALRQAARKAHDIELVRHYDEKLPRVPSDPLLLHQVFLNVVMNAEQAVAATGRPGRIEVTTARGAAGDSVVATIRDTGSGIQTDTLPRIFEPFYTTKEVGQGTGLGLAIAYGIVQEHGGQISAANHPEGGAVITIELPAPQTAAAAKRA